MMRSPASIVPTASSEATASPPADLISSTTSWAGPASLPLPSMLTPRSTTTTLAPSAANSIAVPRPIPRPEPVTTAVLPSSQPSGITHLLVYERHTLPRCERLNQSRDSIALFPRPPGECYGDGVLCVDSQQSESIAPRVP